MSTHSTQPSVPQNVAVAEVLAEYGPFAGASTINGVSHDGHHVWAATGEVLVAFDPATGAAVREWPLTCDAGTAFDGTHLYQIAGTRIDRIDPKTGTVLDSIPAPGGGTDSGMAWAEGCLWVGQYRERRIHQVDPQTGAILRTIPSDRFVTGVTWVDDALWHGTWEDGRSDLRRVDAATGSVLERLDMPAGNEVSGLEWDGGARFYCGGGNTGVVRAVRVPGRG